VFELDTADFINAGNVVSVNSLNLISSSSKASSPRRRVKTCLTPLRTCPRTPSKSVRSTRILPWTLRSDLLKRDRNSGVSYREMRMDWRRNLALHERRRGRSVALEPEDGAKPEHNSLVVKIPRLDTGEVTPVRVIRDLVHVLEDELPSPTQNPMSAHAASSSACCPVQLTCTCSQFCIAITSNPSATTTSILLRLSTPPSLSLAILNANGEATIISHPMSLSSPQGGRTTLHAFLVNLIPNLKLSSELPEKVLT
jgi:hypothetical protein